MLNSVQSLMQIHSSAARIGIIYRQQEGVGNTLNIMCDAQLLPFHQDRTPVPYDCIYQSVISIILNVSTPPNEKH